MWQTPKTNWKAEYDAAGGYLGDFVNIGDYNRIKNNAAHILSIAPQVVYDDYPTMGPDKVGYLGYPYASEWNEIENALEQLARNISNSFPAMLFYDNGNTLNFVELNRIESMELTLKDQYETAAEMKHKLSFTLGTSSRDIRP